MFKRRKYQYWYFSYKLYVHESVYICDVEDRLVIGIGEHNFMDAIQDAHVKLLKIPNLVQYAKIKPLRVSMKVDIDDYNQSHTVRPVYSHVFL